jgi:hypothetical protein
MIAIVKLGSGTKRTAGSKYSSVNRTFKLWNKLPAGALATFPCKSYIFRKTIRKVIITEEK